MNNFVLFLMLLLILAGCETFFEDVNHPDNITTPHSATIPPIPNDKPEQNSFVHFLSQNNDIIVALLSLVGILLLYRVYKMEKNRKKIAKLSLDDLSMLKFGKEVMDQIWKRFRPDKNVIRMDDYRE